MKKYTVYLSPIAEYKVLHLLDYIQDEFGDTSRHKFLIRFSEKIRTLESNPFICVETEIDGIYKCIVTRQTSFFFEYGIAKLK